MTLNVNYLLQKKQMVDTNGQLGCEAGELDILYSTFFLLLRPEMGI